MGRGSSCDALGCALDGLGPASRRDGASARRARERLAGAASGLVGAAGAVGLVGSGLLEKGEMRRTLAVLLLDRTRQEQETGWFLGRTRRRFEDLQFTCTIHVSIIIPSLTVLVRRN